MKSSSPWAAEAGVVISPSIATGENRFPARSLLLLLAAHSPQFAFFSIFIASITWFQSHFPNCISDSSTLRPLSSRGSRDGTRPIKISRSTTPLNSGTLQNPFCNVRWHIHRFRKVDVGLCVCVWGNGTLFYSYRMRNSEET